MGNPNRIESSIIARLFVSFCVFSFAFTERRLSMQGPQARHRPYIDITSDIGLPDVVSISLPLPVRAAIAPPPKSLRTVSAHFFFVLLYFLCLRCCCQLLANQAPIRSPN